MPDGVRCELKHLSNSRKRNQRDSVSKRRAKAEESKPDSQELGVAGLQYGRNISNRNTWKGVPKSVTAVYIKLMFPLVVSQVP